MTLVNKLNKGSVFHHCKPTLNDLVWRYEDEYDDKFMMTSSTHPYKELDSLGAGCAGGSTGNVFGDDSESSVAVAVAAVVLLIINSYCTCKSFSFNPLMTLQEYGLCYANAEPVT